jgi:hypothetical protein
MIRVTWAEPAWRGPITVLLPYDGRDEIRPRKVWLEVKIGPFDSREEYDRAMAANMAISNGLGTPRAWKMVVGDWRPQASTGLFDRLREDFPGCFDGRR